MDTGRAPCTARRVSRSGACNAMLKSNEIFGNPVSRAPVISQHQPILQAERPSAPSRP